MKNNIRSCRLNPANIILIIAFNLILMICIATVKPSTTHNAHLAKPQYQQRVCDPYKSLSGYVDNITGVFAPIDNSEFGFKDPFSSCSIAGFDHYGALLAAATDPDRLSRSDTLLPSHLANKVVLLYGDSFERKIAMWLCEAAGIDIMHAKLNGSFVSSTDALPADCKICSITSGPAVFSVIAIFHFGVADTMPENARGNQHWDWQFSPYNTKDRITWLPYFLRAIASRAFPQICKFAGETCPDAVDKDETNEGAIFADSIPPLLADGEFWFPKPDIIIAQSSLWALTHTEVSDVYGNAVDFLKFWLSKFKMNTLDTMYHVFGKYVKNHVVEETGEIVHRFYTRTIPLPDCPPDVCPEEDSLFYNPTSSVINWMNRMLRSGMFENTNITGAEENVWGLLDWEALVAHTEIHEVETDTFHPGHKATVVFCQHLFTRLHILDGLER